MCTTDFSIYCVCNAVGFQCTLCIQCYRISVYIVYTMPSDFSIHYIVYTVLSDFSVHCVYNAVGF